MKTREAIDAEIKRIIQANYYSEDFQLLSEFQVLASGLSMEEKNTWADIAKERLNSEGSIVDILLCAVVDVPSVVPLLAKKLSAETETNQITRTLIATLSRYSSDEAYLAVERFLDSDQEAEALGALARIDFIRTLPVMVRCMKKDHYAGMILQMLHERIKKTGLQKLIDELRHSSATQVAGFHGQLKKILHSKDSDYNPLSGSETDALLEAFAQR